jgi:hypothetical protein
LHAGVYRQSECYNDLRTIAAAGMGYDPEWDKTIGY